MDVIFCMKGLGTVLDLSLRMCYAILEVMMPREKRQRCASGLYHVIQRAQVHKLFEDSRDKEAFLHILEQSKHKNAFALFGFCLALDGEYHLLLGTNACDLSKIMKEINIRYALYKEKKSIFKDRFFSTPLQDVQAVYSLREWLQTRRTLSEDAHYPNLCTAFHFLIDDPQTYVPSVRSMDIEAVMQDLQEELARLGLSASSLHEHPELRKAWILKTRRSSSLSLKQIGNLLGLSESSISKILNA